MKTYSLFGTTFTTDFPFASRLLLSNCAPEITFLCDNSRSSTVNFDETKPIYISPQQNKNGESICCLYRFHDIEVLRFYGITDFFLFPKKIVCSEFHSSNRALVEILFLGQVFAYWLEKKGCPVLHASTIAVKNNAVTFVSGNKGGKSSLAAAFMQAGYSMLADDMLAIQYADEKFFGLPAYPTMRLWPSETSYFLKTNKNLQLVHPKLTKRYVPVGLDSIGSFCNIRKELACIYILTREESEQANGKNRINIEIVSPKEGVIQLIKYSFSPMIAEASGLAKHRFDILTQLLNRVPIKRIKYPSGYDTLPQVRDAIIADLL